MKLFCLFVLAFAGNALARPQFAGVGGFGLPGGGVPVVTSGLTPEAIELYKADIAANAAKPIDAVVLTITQTVNDFLKSLSDVLGKISTRLNESKGILSANDKIEINENISEIFGLIKYTRRTLKALRDQSAANLAQILTDKEKLLDAVEALAKVVLSLLTSAIGGSTPSTTAPPTTVSPTSVSSGLAAIVDELKALIGNLVKTVEQLVVFSIALDEAIQYGKKNNDFQLINFIFDKTIKILHQNEFNKALQAAGLNDAGAGAGTGLFASAGAGAGTGPFAGARPGPFPGAGAGVSGTAGGVF